MSLCGLSCQILSGSRTALAEESCAAAERKALPTDIKDSTGGEMAIPKFWCTKEPVEKMRLKMKETDNVVLPHLD